MTNCHSDELEEDSSPERLKLLSDIKCELGEVLFSAAKQHYLTSDEMLNIIMHFYGQTSAGVFLSMSEFDKKTSLALWNDERPNVQKFIDKMITRVMSREGKETPNYVN